MKVLIFSTAYFPFVGGAEVSIWEITNHLTPQIEFDLITARLDKTLPKVEKIGHVTVYRIGIGIPLFDKLLVPFAGAVKTLKLQKKNHYRAYWCIMASFASGAAFIANWFQRKVPIILTLQEGDSEEYLKKKWGGLINLSWWMALTRAPYLTAISNYLIGRAKELGFKGEAFLIPNGVDIERFKNPHPQTFDANNVTLVTTSRLNIKNGVGDVIEALAYLPESVKFQILGTGELEKSLRAKVKKLKLEHRVEFLGFVSPEQVPEYLHQADIFVRPSLSEGMGNSFIEAMAAGLPVVATPVGGIPDFLKDGETGVFCEPHNPQSVAEAVKRLITDSAFRDKVTMNALAMVRERYDWDLIADRMKTQVFAKV